MVQRISSPVLGFLVRNLRGGVTLVLSYRSDELHRRHPLRPFLAELERGRRVERLELGRLSRRELADGRTNRQIAGRLYITHKTASTHVSHILAKLGVSNRSEAAAVAHRLGLAN